MIDTDVEVQAVFFKRWLTAKRLREILSQLDDDDLLIPNRVGNLAVTRAAKQVGYIDFNEEAFEDYSVDDEEES